MKNLYQLTAAQKMHNDWIIQYKTQQVAGVSVVVSLKANLDFSLLEKCILLEYDRYNCMNLRMTKPDDKGNVFQYIYPDKNRKIITKDLSHMSLEQADSTMQNWAYETFDEADISLCDICLVKLPEGYNGFFIHMDHRLIDSSGMIVMINDIMSLYTHFKFNSPYPEDLCDYEMVLQKDIKKATNNKLFSKDKKFWDNMLDTYGEPLYSDVTGLGKLKKDREKHKNPNMRSADIELENLFVDVIDYQLEPEATKKLMNFCMTNQITMTNLLLLGIRTYLSKVNDGQEDISIQNFISRRSTNDEWKSGGSRTIMFPCRSILSSDTDFLSAAYEIQNIQNKIYMHSNYDPSLIYKEIKKRYNTPENTCYESFFLTYQPMPIKLENPHLKGMKHFSKWYANGAATKKTYLTVSHLHNGGMNFSFHYQTAELCQHDMELVYYYLMRILFKGIERPDISLLELMESV